ncbi:kinase-like domain-containing protein [Thamnocephalis sphaerospora]|uniref:Kinase-like domain-containing protein n=1 Tax=Thamnocephalis sphaerospora TaxID=78915 RepID=A0A4P9XUC6_9FUNG|nr:kinase-like domain-containing protein [Thamnocephalis sphaerospora]|eukprot:RKP09813.1 kinase-like domain-containing protein [Thamnocephalis sphaerospora]
MLIDDSDRDEIGEIAYDQLTYGRKLGSGGFKDCFAGNYLGQAFCITVSSAQRSLRRIRIYRQLRHDNIVRFIGVCTSTKHLCIVTELCENGDLYDYMRRARKPSFGQQVIYMHDIAFGVSYLHTRRPSIIHRDLKSMNILISADERAKINDFGLARIRPRANTLMHTQCGTPNWQAPEFWTPNPSYTEKVYACGLIFWEILQWAAEPFPYHNLTEHQLFVQVRDRNHRPSMVKLKTMYPPSLLELIEEMWHQDPTKRPSMGMVVERLADFLS